MSYEFGGMLYQTEGDMLSAIVEHWMTAGGANSAAQIEGFLSVNTDQELVDDLLSAWSFDNVTREDLVSAMAEYRRARSVEPTVVDRYSRTGMYDMVQQMVVVDHPEHGRLLLVEGFGGMDSLQGGAYRWEHGAAYQLQPSDTLESLKAGQWNEWTPHIDAVLGGHDHTRPILDWDGDHIAALARSVE